MILRKINKNTVESVGHQAVMFNTEDNMEDHIAPDHRARIAQNIITYMYQPIEDIHKNVIKKICQDMMSVAFKYRGKTYTPYTMGKATKIELLPDRFKEEFDKHLEKYNIFTEKRIQVEWAFAEIFGRARTYWELYNLIPEPLQSASGISLPTMLNDSEPGRVLHFKNYYKDKYELLGSEIVKRMLIV